MARRRASRTGNVLLPWERRGLPLAELLTGRRIGAVALAGLAVLLAGAIWRSVDTRDRVSRTELVIADVRRAVAQFREDLGRCPHTMRELAHPPRAGARYLRDEPLDAWGNPLWVRCPGRYDPEGMDVVSAGPSGNFLVDDNIQ